jgi:hypothetical protein
MTTTSPSGSMVQSRLPHSSPCVPVFESKAPVMSARAAKTFSVVARLQGSRPLPQGVCVCK